ncbi:MAG: methylated-DNA--[protein]-cysteine S-methyltransferase [bacterium]
MPASDDINYTLRVLITSSPRGLKEVHFDPWPDEQEFSELAVYRVQISLLGEFLFCTALDEDLKAYFSGQAVSFASYPVDWQGMSPFVRKVLEASRSIPWGETRTYGWLGTRLGLKSGARAVGGALGRNPLPIIIPCHRILRKGGQIGGFSGGIQWKKFLLSLEGKTSLNTLVEFPE